MTQQEASRGIRRQARNGHTDLCLQCTLRVVKLHAHTLFAALAVGRGAQDLAMLCKQFFCTAQDATIRIEDTHTKDGHAHILRGGRKVIRTEQLPIIVMRACRHFQETLEHRKREAREGALWTCHAQIRRDASGHRCSLHSTPLHSTACVPYHALHSTAWHADIPITFGFMRRSRFVTTRTGSVGLAKLMAAWCQWEPHTHKHTHTHTHARTHTRTHTHLGADNFCTR